MVCLYMGGFYYVSQWNDSPWFGRGGRRSHHYGEMKTRDKHLRLNVKLEDIYVGKDYVVEVNRQIICPKCDGRGSETPDDVHTCPYCEGKGERVVLNQFAPGFTFKSLERCSHCGGKGVVIKKKCPHCKGEGIVSEKAKLKVPIEKGVPDGHSIILSEESDQHPDYTPGDVVLHLQTFKSAQFERVGNDLFTNFTVELWKALYGFSIEIRHLDGHVVKYKTSSITNPYDIVEIKGEGMPHHNSRQKGSLFVKFFIEFPEMVTNTQEKEIKKLLSGEPISQKVFENDEDE